MEQSQARRRVQLPAAFHLEGRLQSLRLLVVLPQVRALRLLMAQLHCQAPHLMGQHRSIRLRQPLLALKQPTGLLQSQANPLKGLRQYLALNLLLALPRSHPALSPLMVQHLCPASCPKGPRPCLVFDRLKGLLRYLAPCPLKEQRRYQVLDPRMVHLRRPAFSLLKEQRQRPVLHLLTVQHQCPALHLSQGLLQCPAFNRHVEPLLYLAVNPLKVLHRYPALRCLMAPRQYLLASLLKKLRQRLEANLLRTGLLRYQVCSLRPVAPYHFLLVNPRLKEPCPYPVFSLLMELRQ